MQVKELYGPLLAVITASKSAFDAMVRQHSPDGTRASFIHAAQAQPDSKEGQTYRYGDAQAVNIPYFYKSYHGSLYCNHILPCTQIESACYVNAVLLSPILPLSPTWPLMPAWTAMSALLPHH